jgi:hypothetical protein
VKKELAARAKTPSGQNGCGSFHKKFEPKIRSKWGAATRLAEKNALLHILNYILNLEDNSKLNKACKYEIVTSPLGLVSFTPLEVEDVEYMEGTVQTKFNKGHKGLIYAFLAGHGNPWEIGWCRNP